MTDMLSQMHFRAPFDGGPYVFEETHASSDLPDARLFLVGQFEPESPKELQVDQYQKNPKTNEGCPTCNGFLCNSISAMSLPAQLLVPCPNTALKEWFFLSVSLSSHRSGLKIAASLPYRFSSRPSNQALLATSMPSGTNFPSRTIPPFDTKRGNMSGDGGHRRRVSSRQAP